MKPSSLTQPAAFSTNSQSVIDPNMKTPTTHQWSFSIQRQILRDTVLDVTYVGRRAYHLFGAYNVNQAILFQNGFADAFKVVQSGGDSLRGRFDYLSHQTSNQCNLQAPTLQSYPATARLQGSCCSPMVYASYVKQIHELTAYSDPELREMRGRGERLVIVSN